MGLKASKAPPYPTVEQSQWDASLILPVTTTLSLDFLFVCTLSLSWQKKRRRKKMVSPP